MTIDLPTLHAHAADLTQQQAALTAAINDLVKQRAIITKQLRAVTGRLVTLQLQGERPADNG